MNSYKKLEAMLYNYKNTLAEIKNIKIEIEDVEQSYSGISSICYDNMPKANTISSSVEREIEHKEKRIEYLTNLLVKKENEIKRIDNAIEVLTDSERNLIELCYFNKVRVKDAAIKLYVTEQTICRNKSTIINKLIPLIYIE